MRPVTPVCVKCKVFFDVKEGGVIVEEMAEFGSYQLWRADLLQCPLCGTQVIDGFGSEPAMVHGQKDYDDNLRRLGKTYKVFPATSKRRKNES